MAKFILGNSFKDTLGRHRWLRNSIWFTESLILGGLLRLLSLLPVDKASAFGRRLGRVLGPRLPKHRSIVKNLRLAFPEKSAAEIEVLALGIWSNAGAVLSEFASLGKISGEDRTEVRVPGEIEGFRRPGRPVIMVTAHLSNWEVLSGAITRVAGPVSAPFTPPANPWLARQLAAVREPLGVNLLARDSSIRSLYREISAGQSLVFLMDQRVDSGRPVPFMGRDKLTTLVPARLGVRFGCEIVPVRVQRRANARYLVTFHSPVRPDNPEASEMEQAIDVTAKINRLFESWIREQPDEWFCSNRMWPKEYEARIAE